MKIALIAAALLMAIASAQVDPANDPPVLTNDELAKFPALMAGRQEVIKAYNAYVKTLGPWRADVSKVAEGILAAHGCTKVVEAACTEGSIAGWGLNFDSLQMVYNKPPAPAKAEPKKEKK
jgi:hypothetical protein